MNITIVHLFDKYVQSKVRFNEAMHFVNNMLYITLDGFVYRDSNNSSLLRIMKQSLRSASMLLTLGHMYIPRKQCHHKVNMIGSALTFLYRAVLGILLHHWKRCQAIEMHQVM